VAGTSKRGFSSMDKSKQREIASKGGKAAHQKGTAHEFTPEEAREAGRKGGAASRARRKELAQQRTERHASAGHSGVSHRGDDESKPMREEESSEEE